MEAKENLLTTMGMDGKRWSEEFCQRFPQCAEDDVLGWFCNAIMAGYDEGAKVGIKEVVEWISETAIMGYRENELGVKPPTDLVLDLCSWQSFKESKGVADATKPLL